MRVIRAACVGVCVMLGLMATRTQAADAAPQLVRAAAPDWPQWRGPRRDGVSDEVGLLKAWPAGGPKRVWTASGLGHGYSSPIIVGDTIYITGDKDKELVITALSSSGEIRWHAKNGSAWTGSYPGARAACCFDDGKLYHMNAHGRLACFDAATGSERWAVNTLARFKAENIIWGISEAVLVHGDHVFATPGGTEALMVALDKRTGAIAWTTPGLADEKACYSSPILLQAADRLMLVNCGSRHAFAVDAKTGELLWKTPHVDPRNSVTSTPVYVGGRMLITNSSRNGGATYGVQLDGTRGTMAWESTLTFSHGGLVFAMGRAWGSSSRGDHRGWVAVDPASGASRSLAEPPGGSLIYADERLYVLTERGTILLQEPAADGLKTHGSFVLAEERDVWAHPVICNGRLFLRYNETLYCFDIR